MSSAPDYTECFICDACPSLNCPIVYYEYVCDMVGSDLAADMGLERYSCKDCSYMTYRCEDCLLYQTPECKKFRDQELRKGGDENGI